MIFDITILKQMWKASTAGLNIVIATVIGGAIGYFLEKLFGMESHWLLFIFALLGVAAGFKDLFNMIKNIDDRSDKENK
ncbi:MAG: AtpZ/AtpI family protein [Thermodesulfovibrionales bacterium]|nr:AtpZ/AtpI family protein [Thermodesulfovibrionales bacterium]